MKAISSSALLLILLLTTITPALASSPNTNTIPIISMKTGIEATCEDITMDVLLMLLWNNFDGIWIAGKFNDNESAVIPATLCDSTGAVMILAPSTLAALNFWPASRWGRYTPEAISDSSAFIKPTSDFMAISDSLTAPAMISLIETLCNTLKDSASVHNCIWYFDLFNEPSAWQLNRMLNDSSAFDDYFPSVFAQDTLMNQVLSSGVFSWAKWKSDSLYTSLSHHPTVSTTLSMLHTIEDSVWAGYAEGVHLGNEDTQANSVNAYFDMEYLVYSSTPPYSLEDNTPERLDLNAYPIRFAGYTWQISPPESITVLGSATDLWMLQHYELYMDSTFIPAGDHEDGPFPIHYHPQSFGRSGGRAVWKATSSSPPDTVLQYNPYAYRLPSPAEFRMLCNIGLLRGAKGVFPYSIRSSESWKDDTLLFHDTAMLDENLIPYDAPYEDWVYRDRPVDDYYNSPPDLIPPWTAADSSQFDPLYTLPSQPVPAVGSQRNTENYLVWKFAPYARLWNSVRGTFRQIAWVAPELSRLWWWFAGDRYDNASIEYDGIEPTYFADPHIRVFTDSTETSCYLFYVNRFCRANNNPFEIEVNYRDFPTGTQFSEHALDHSRRCLIEGNLSGTIYTFLDTLDAGEARLLQMFNADSGLAADIRITDPDVFAVLPVDGDTLTDNSSTEGTAVDIHAWLYNMGTESMEDVKVYLRNKTTDRVMDSVNVSFNGLSTDSCWKPDRALASFPTWTPGANRIGVNVLEVYTEDITGEPDPADNSATLVYLVNPKDYATEVLDDPWDMDDDTLSNWYTTDIDSLTGAWDRTAYTDSISGMFEGLLASPADSNALYLNIGTGIGDYIDADTYHNLSFAGRSNIASTVTLHWVDSANDSGQVSLGDTLRATAADFGPYDISSLSESWDGYIKLLWFELHGGNVESNVRFGWVKLTE